MVAGLALVVLIMVARHFNNPRETAEIKIYLQDLEITQYTWAHVARLQKARDTMRKMGVQIRPGVLRFTGVETGGSRVLWVYSLVHLTQESRNLKGGEKTRGSNDPLEKSTKISKSKEPQWGEVAWLFI